MSIKNYKQRTLDAVRESIKRFKSPWGVRFFTPHHCPVCSIYAADYKRYTGCRGCYMAIEERFIDDGKKKRIFSQGCHEFKLYRNARVDYMKIKKKTFSYGCYYPKSDDHPHRLESFANYSLYLEYVYGILETIDSKRFTPSGWTQFTEIDRDRIIDA